MQKFEADGTIAQPPRQNAAKETTGAWLVLKTQCENTGNLDWLPMTFWDEAAEKVLELEEGDYIHVKGRLRKTQKYGLQIHIREVKTADELNKNTLGECRKYMTGF